jgi:hypothetical protein
MKKLFIAIVASVASVSAIAQVDSVSVDSTAMTTTPSDSSSQAGVATDTTSATVASADTAAISDEDLKKYAIVMDSVDGMKQALLTQISTKIKSNGKIKIARYNQLSKAIDDEAKLQELKATPDEIAFVKEVAALKTEGAAKISDQVETMANDFVGVEKYNKIKSSLESDTALKTRYDEIFSEIQGQGTASAKTSN